MKSFNHLAIALATVCASFSAQALIIKETIVIVSGGMGTDGATGESTPRKNSVDKAAEIYEALNVPANSDGEKEVGIMYDGDIIGITCRKPKQGTNRLEARCEYGTLTKELAPANGISIGTGSVELAPAISQMIFEALKSQDNKGRVGAVVKEAGNLRCTKAVRPGVKAKCILSNVSLQKMAIEVIPEESQKELREFAKQLGL
jgi:hypothetical protein